MKPNYIVIPFISLLTMWMGRGLTTPGLAWYYKILALPGLSLDDWVLSVVWMGIFVCVTIAALIVWNCFERDVTFWSIQVLFLLNILLTSQWSYFLFGTELVEISIIQALALEGIGVMLMCVVSKHSRLVGYLLVPYALCGGFALYPYLIAWWLTYVRD